MTLDTVDGGDVRTRLKKLRFGARQSYTRQSQRRPACRFATSNSKGAPQHGPRSFLAREEASRDGEGGEGLEEVGPGGEDREGRQGCDLGEEARSLFGRVSGSLPGRLDEVEYSVSSEGEYVEGGERHGHVILTVAKIVLEFVAVVFQDIEAFVVNRSEGFHLRSLSERCGASRLTPLPSSKPAHDSSLPVYEHMRLILGDTFEEQACPCLVSVQPFERMFPLSADLILAFMTTSQ